MFRKTIFWLHLGTGVVVGLVVAMMSFTGVLLTYERQLIEWADSASWAAPEPGARRLGVEELTSSAIQAGIPARKITFFDNDLAPALVGGGRRDPSTYVDSYTAEVLGHPNNSMRETMETLTAWHRWFDLDGDFRARGALITGVSNLAFLFLLISGAYLWLPKIYRWPLFRQRLRFASSYRNAKDRDFYWHHILAAWSLLPLLVLVLTAVVISFSWANKLLGGLAGDTPAREAVLEFSDAPLQSEPLNLDVLLRQAMAQSDSWKSIALTMPSEESRTVEFELDEGSGRQPHKRRTIILDRYSGEIVGTRSFADRASTSKAIAWNRYLHTGESFGVLGQTIAGLASIASLILVWTGLALAWRRLIVPLYGGSRT